ncbi:MAG: hypothetical protein ACRDG6_11550 [Candidatus Limnocylindria bacterium]
MSFLGRTAIALVLSGGAVLLALPVPFAPPAQAAAATCTSTVGPGIPPPASVPSGLPGFHASWYGQSGYPTLCPGEFSSAVVAYYNSGSRGWQSGRLGEMAFLGTWNPTPGQDRASQLGGDGTAGSPATGWPRYNRVAAQPAPWVGPNQVSWFRFIIRAPTTPGTYRLYVRPLIEGALWMEDFGVFWQVTVKDSDDVGVTPTSPATLSAGDGRAYAATLNAPSGCVDVAFVDAASYPDNGTFADASPNDAKADLSQAAAIASLGGAAFGAPYLDCYFLPTGGTLSFSVSSVVPDAFVRPIVFRDANGNNALDLDSANRPLETFGVGGSVSFIPAEGSVGSQTVVVGTVNTTNNFFTNSSGTVTFRYDTNDAYQYGGAGITLSQFEQVLSTGDTVIVNYIPSSSGASTFNLTNDVGRGAPSVSATAGSFDGGSTQNDLQVQIFEPSSNVNGISYSVQRATVAATAPCGPSAGTYAQIVTITIPTGSNSTTYVDEDRLSGTYCYRVGATNPVTGTTAFGYSNAVTIANPPTPVDPTGAPTSLDARVTTNVGSSSVLDAGDVVKIAFSEAMSPAAAGATVRARDADGTIGDLICGTNATCTLNTSPETLGGQSRAAQTVLTVRLTANPVIIASGTTATLRIPATVIDRAAITDPSGDPWNLEGSTDIVLGSPD